MDNEEKLESLIYKYRMMGFDNPVFENNSYFRCVTVDVCDPCGEWRLIKGNSKYSCMVGALKWIKINWKQIQRERQLLVRSYIKHRRKTAMKKVFVQNYGN